MRWSRYFLHTTREVPSDAEVVSHRLMVRAGMIRKLAAGIYTYLPFGWRSLRKLMTIVRRELDAAGAVELNMPAIQPAALWEESGRWEKYGKELLRLTDRHERPFCFGPTHEEVVTEAVRGAVKSYRQLPVNLFQIQVKFRDEIRPRFGLMRGREFLMKDGYSFDVDDEGLTVTYDAMGRAYERIFEECQLRFLRVEADSGTIGGTSSHEFMVLAETGESEIASCAACGYGANVERAAAGALEPPPAGPEGERRVVETPGRTTVDEVAAFLGVAPAQIVKTLVYETENGPVVALGRGDREIHPVKLGNAVGAAQVQLAGETTVREITGSPVGYAGPVGLAEGVAVVADETVRPLTGFVTGANRADAHLVGVNWTDEDLPAVTWADLLTVTAGDPCPRCGEELAITRGIEVGHIFRLGDAYSEPMGCVYTDENGDTRPMIMGCYGLGIGRTIAAAIEQNHDEKGIIWPRPLAPFEVLVMPLTSRDPEVVREAERIYEELRAKGADVLLDDRDERPGVKFNDADLIGVPVRVVIGSRSLAEGKVELSHRRDGEKRPTSTARAVERALEMLLDEDAPAG
ncbi:MAG: proline--tRNA ligase [Thermoanaerobaculia bacterium]|nr:proline--tRNA ligase [Thermoanaerobaculia bacterium]